MKTVKRVVSTEALDNLINGTKNVLPKNTGRDVQRGMFKSLPKGTGKNFKRGLF